MGVVIKLSGEGLSTRRNYMPADTEQPLRGQGPEAFWNDKSCWLYSLAALDPRIQCYRRVVQIALVDLKPFYPS